jgi:hypothetical protein
MPLVQILVVDLHTRFVLSQNLEKYKVKSFIENLSSQDRLVISTPISGHQQQKANYLDFDQNYTWIFRDLLELYDRSSLRVIYDSREYLLAAILFVCGYDCAPTGVVSAGGFREIGNEKVEKLGPGVQLDKVLLKAMLLGVKTMGDLGICSRSELTFVFKKLREKLYNEFHFDLATLAEKIEISLNGLDDFRSFI